MVNPSPFTPAEKDRLRTYMMVPKPFATPHALLESIFDSIDGLFDDPTDQGATQAAIRTVLAKLATVENDLAQLESAGFLLGTDVQGEVTYDAARAILVLRQITGPALINQLASRLAFYPDDDYFDPVKTMPGREISYREPRYN